MGSFDGAEVCELVGLYILNILSQKFGSGNIGLYRDDGLGCFQGINGSKADKIRKEIIKVFRDLDLKITISTNIKTVNFLDITFDLASGTYKPYNKPAEKPLYINKLSNHPPNIIKRIPTIISKRISNISSNREIFDAAAPFYNKSLAESGYNEQIEYFESRTSNKRKRSRKVLWYNPPFSISVKTNIAHKFLQLISRHFPKGHKLHKLFNRNNVKVSYSCMPNFGSIISSHNRNVLENTITSRLYGCNCRRKDECPLRGNCLDRNVIYRAKVSAANSGEAHYIGITENDWKDRSYKHRNSFTDPNKRSSTQLSKHIWKLKDNGINLNDIKIDWDILDHAKPCIPGTRRCHLCLTEKYHIISSSLNLLNKRSELISKCRHENKHQLASFKEVPPDSRQ